MKKRDYYFKNYIDLQIICKTRKLSAHLGGAQIWAKCQTNGGAHKIYVQFMP